MSDLQQHSFRFGRDCALPVLVTMVVFNGLNFIWNLPAFGLRDYLPHSIPVYMIGGSSLGLWWLWDAYRRGALSPQVVGMEASGWSPWRRVVGLGLVFFFVLGGISTMPNVVEIPHWGDYLWWFLFLLPASLAELMVFLVVGYCLPEAWLRSRGANAVTAFIPAAIFAGVAFGLYHFTHHPRWHQYAFQLIPVMWVNLTYFAISRNFHLTLLLHNAFAAVGFSGEQYRTSPPEEMMNPATYQVPHEIALLSTAFVVPWLILHVIESKFWRDRYTRSRETSKS